MSIMCYFVTSFFHFNFPVFIVLYHEYHVKVLHSFLLLNNTALYRYARFIYAQSMDLRVESTWLRWIMLLSIFLDKFLCGNLSPLSLPSPPWWSPQVDSKLVAIRNSLLIPKGSCSSCLCPWCSLGVDGLPLCPGQGCRPPQLHRSEAGPDALSLRWLM